jgi:hypothetical protein
MVNAPKKNLVPVPEGNYGKSTMHFTRRRHQANNDKSGLGEARVRASGALRSLQCKKKLAAENQQEMPCF